jgi:hypothetical protein
MKAYKTYLTVKGPKKVVLSDIPFSSGQRIEVVLRAAEGDIDKQLKELKDVLKATQGLPQAQIITEQEIAEEVDSFRRGC